MSIKNFFDGGKQISDSVGAPLNGGLCYFYDPGTTTPKNTYTTSAIAVANANPVVLDSSGRANIWLNGNYRTIVKDSSGNTIYDEDNINPSSSTSVTAVSGSATLALADAGKILEVNGSGITLTLTAAATLGAGWYVDYISTDSANTFTFSRANTGNTINGSASDIVIQSLQAGRLYVNQAANGFYTEGDVTGRGNNIFSGSMIAKTPGPSNARLTASVGSSALTINLVGNDGNAPSTSNPVYVPFRNVTSATGDTTWLAVTAATSVVVSSGSTLGTISGVLHKLAVVSFNDGGTFRMGVENVTNFAAATGAILSDNVIASSTAEGGAGAADSASVIYTGTAVSSKAMTILGLVESTQATAGTWATAVSKIEAGTAWNVGMKPGTVVLNSGSVAAGATLDVVMTSYTGYRNKKLVIDNYRPATDNTTLQMRFSTDGGSTFDAGAGNYNYSGMYVGTAATVTGFGSGAATSIIISGVGIDSDDAAGQSLIEIDLANTTAAVYTIAKWNCGALDSANDSLTVSGSGKRITAQDTDAVRLFSSSGNITRLNWVLYGYN